MIKKIGLGILAIIALAMAGVFLFAKDFTVQIPEAMAQDAVDSLLAEGPINHLGVEITFETASIEFNDDNTATIKTKFDTMAFGYPNRVEGTFQSGIRYSAPRIYLNDIVPVQIEVETNEETKSELDELTSAARKFLERQKKTTKSEKNAETIDKIIGDGSEDFKQSIVKGTYIFFEKIPVYNLESAGYKGSLASLALKDVQFSDDFATVTLSPVQALIKILSIIGAILLTILYLGKGLIASFLIDKLKKDKPKKTISGYIDVPPADRADFALALPEHTRLTNLEPGCQYFRVIPDPVIEGRYLVDEAFDDDAAYTAHMVRTKKTKWARITRNVTRSYEID